MPSNKKKNTADKKKKQQERKAKQEAGQAICEFSPEFRDLLFAARKEYSKGRAYDAAQLLQQALVFGSDKLPRFNDNSLIKAHALVELSCFKSAVLTDFARGEEWHTVKKEGNDACSEALQIFERRLASGTLTKFRKDEVWFDATGDYTSPVPHTERLGPVDYLSSLKLCFDPSPKTVRSLKLAMDFFTRFEASGHVIELECGGALQGMLPGEEIEKLKEHLNAHESVVSGQSSVEEAMDRMNCNTVEEVRHNGEGKMKYSHRKLNKEVDKLGLKTCENQICGRGESQPRQFNICSRCGWAAYCCRDCQKADWKRHKKECKSGEAAEKRKKEEDQNNSNNCLMVGQSQQVLLIIRYLHHFTCTSEELQQTHTEDARRAIHTIKPELEEHELGTIQLGMESVALMWSAFWSMTRQSRSKLIRKFLKTMKGFHFPQSAPDFDVVTNWSALGKSGDFAVVEHTPNGSILLHEEEDGTVNGYVAVGITQPLETLMKNVPKPLPLFVNTAVIPFKGQVLCQGTIFPSLGTLSRTLQIAARAYVEGNKSEVTIIESLS